MCLLLKEWIETSNPRRIRRLPSSFLSGRQTTFHYSLCVCVWTSGWPNLIDSIDGPPSSPLDEWTIEKAVNFEYRLFLLTAWALSNRTPFCLLPKTTNTNKKLFEFFSRAHSFRYSTEEVYAMSGSPREPRRNTIRLEEVQTTSNAR